MSVKIHYRTDGNFFNLRRLKSYTKVTRAIVRDFFFADDCALAAHSKVDLQELADSFATGATSFGLTVSIKKTEVLRQLASNTARPPPNTQHHHGWKCAEKCRQLQIPRQLHKLCRQPWWWPSKQNYITGILLQYYLLLCLILVRHITGTSRRKTRHFLI